MAKPKSEPTTPQTRRRSLSDPFAAILAPPPNESQSDRDRRLKAEANAKKISDNIDELLKQEKADKKKKQVVKVLLLGQSESGKSTTLKQFQLMHTPAAFAAERIAWRSVIYLNLVRSIIRILDAVSPTPTPEPAPRQSISSASSDSPDIPSNDFSNVPPIPQAQYEYFKTVLAPLFGLEDKLIGALSAPDEDEAVRLGPLPSKSSSSSTSSLGSAKEKNATNGKVGGEFTLHTTNNWKKKAFSFGSFRGKHAMSNSATGDIPTGWWEDPEDPCHVLGKCRGAMLELWGDGDVRSVLEARRVRLEESSGFYLDEIDRITAMRYVPTDDDVLRARLKTIGVVEHSFLLSRGTSRGVEWKIYDVGGARNQRQAWAPYFEDVNAIIFLAPVSAFDLVLAEDSRVNRLEDSLLLWKSVVSNKLLAGVNIILFLNKCDLLQAKLDAGVRLNDHMVSYGDRPNDYDSVSKYFRNKFGLLHQQYTPNKDRELYIHFTSVTDTKATHTIITNVRDIILKGNLKEIQLI
ncbi:hypothetical protein JAAARDRAFT_199327 [Jaapia argillacea MUCL 33604]|uniref:G-alpha-domain-containing protein n=1 Tax=Jaapia argillacea MUCL 33604 TaxID=933084 RepID=A0A067P870_9AGAM|nr:hypothetical protein JAAARDRAFT_199327 [Jaapia argillacea MUCL 33604]